MKLSDRVKNFLFRLRRLRLRDVKEDDHGYPVAFRCVSCWSRRWWPMSVDGAYFQQCPACWAAEKENL